MMLSEHVGFVHWNDEECRYPIRHYVEPSKKKRMIVAPTNAAAYTMGGDWTRKIIRLYDFLNPRCDKTSLDIANGGCDVFQYQISCEAEWLLISSLQGEIEKQERIDISINRQVVTEICRSKKVDRIETILSVDSSEKDRNTMEERLYGSTRIGKGITMYEVCNQAYTMHPDFFDPIHQYATVEMKSGDSKFARVYYEHERPSVTVREDGVVEFYMYAPAAKSVAVSGLGGYFVRKKCIWRKRARESFIWKWNLSIRRCIIISGM